MDGTERINIKPGIRVMVVQKEDQRTGDLTEGIVKEILTNQALITRSSSLPISQIEQ